MRVPGAAEHHLCFLVTPAPRRALQGGGRRGRTRAGREQVRGAGSFIGANREPGFVPREIPARPNQQCVASTTVGDHPNKQTDGAPTVSVVVGGVRGKGRGTSRLT